MGIGYVVYDMAEPIAWAGSQIGRGTNNEAEYRALIAGLRHVLRLGYTRVNIYSDSLLVVMQVKGLWKVRGRLTRLRTEAVELLKLMSEYTLTHTERDNNSVADELSRKVAFHEPPQMEKPKDKPTDLARSLFPWQAAYVRKWWIDKRSRNRLLLGRVFQVDTNVITRIVENQSYRSATFEGAPEITEISAV